MRYIINSILYIQNVIHVRKRNYSTNYIRHKKLTNIGILLSNLQY
jgi:hypothetical protein